MGQTRAALQAASSSAALDGWRAKRTRSPFQTINSGATLTIEPTPMRRASACNRKTANSWAQLKRDWRGAKLSDANRAMLGYAEKLTVNPSATTKAELDGLCQHFSEEQAFDIVIIACRFNFMDRLADAFGVELDPFLSRLARSSQEGEALAEVAASTRS